MTRGIFREESETCRSPPTGGEKIRSVLWVTFQPPLPPLQFISTAVEEISWDGLGTGFRYLPLGDSAKAVHFTPLPPHLRIPNGYRFVRSFVIIDGSPISHPSSIGTLPFRRLAPSCNLQAGQVVNSTLHMSFSRCPRRTNGSRAWATCFINI